MEKSSAQSGARYLEYEELTITLCEAQGVPDSVKHSYAVLHFGEHTKRTEASDCDGSNPTWASDFSFSVKAPLRKHNSFTIYLYSIAKRKFGRDVGFGKLRGGRIRECFQRLLPTRAQMIGQRISVIRNLERLLPNAGVDELGSAFGACQRGQANTTSANVDDWNSIFGDGSRNGRETTTTSASVPGDQTKGHQWSGTPGGNNNEARTNCHGSRSEQADEAVSEMRHKDFESQNEQRERQRSVEIVDAQIKRWAAGKEGNLRALLSSLHNILCPNLAGPLCRWLILSTRFQ